LSPARPFLRAIFDVGNVSAYRLRGALQPRRDFVACAPSLILPTQFFFWG